MSVGVESAYKDYVRAALLHRALREWEDGRDALDWFDQWYEENTVPDDDLVTLWLSESQSREVPAWIVRDKLAEIREEAGL